MVFECGFSYISRYGFSDDFKKVTVQKFSSRGTRKVQEIADEAGIYFVTPASRHCENDKNILDKRHEVYERGKLKNPSCWSGKTKNYSRADIVKLNPGKAIKKKESQLAA